MSSLLAIEDAVFLAALILIGVGGRLLERSARRTIVAAATPPRRDADHQAAARRTA